MILICLHFDVAFVVFVAFWGIVLLIVLLLYFAICSAVSGFALVFGYCVCL